MLSRKQRGVIVVAILLVGFALRAYRLDFQSLWHDERITYLTSSSPLSKIIMEPYAASIDRNIPPLYYVIVHFILRFGNQEALLRLPSMVFGFLSILLFYLVLCNWLGRTIGLIGMVIMTISPFHLWYSQEARPYALLLFLSLLSLWLLQQLIKKQTNPWWKPGFVISTAATFYCHTVAIAFIGFLGAYILLVVPPQRYKEWLALFGGTVLLIIPAIYRLLLAPPLISANSSQSFNPFSLVYTLWVFGTGYSLGPTLNELRIPDHMRIVWSYFSLILPVLLFFSVLFLFGALQLWKKDHVIFWLTTLWLLFPLAFTLLGSIFTVHPFNIRYVILSFPPFMAFLAMGVHSLRSNWVRTSAFGIIGIIGLFSLGNYFFAERYHRDNNRAAGQFLSAYALPNDLVIASAPYTAANLQYYYHGTPVRIRTYPQKEDLAKAQDHGTDSRGPDALYVKPAQLESDLEEIIAGQERFWLFLSRTYHSDPEGHIRKFLDERYRRIVQASWAGTELILYQTLPANRN